MKLSKPQAECLEAIKKRGPVDRHHAWSIGFRMTTVRSLVRLGLVVRDETKPGKSVYRVNA